MDNIRENIRLTKSVTVIDAPDGRKIVAIESAERVEIPLIGDALTDFKIVGLPRHANPADLSPSTDFPMLPAEVIALRDAEDLVLKYDEGMEVVLQGFFAPAHSGTIVVSLPAEDAPLLEITSDMVGKVISVNQELLVMRGETPTLLTLAKGDSTLRYAVAETLEVPDSSATSTFWGADQGSSFGLGGFSHSTSIALGGVVAFGAAAASEGKTAEIKEEDKRGEVSLELASNPRDSAVGYKAGDVISFRLTFSKDATLAYPETAKKDADGNTIPFDVPTLKFMIGQGERTATYDSGKSSGSSMILNYTVKDGDWTKEGISMKPVSFDRGDANITYKDKANVDRGFDFTKLQFSADANHKVSTDAKAINATLAADSFTGVDGTREAFTWGSGVRGVDDRIAKFNIADGDHIDLSGLISDFTKGETAKNWIKEYKKVGANTELSIDLDGTGAGSAEQKITLTGVDLKASATDEDALVANGYVVLG